MNLRVVFGGVASVLCVACTPTLNWREIRPEGSGAVALFPCKPSSHVRTVRLASSSAPMALYACTTGGVTYALAHAEVGDPRLVGPALSELRTATAANLAAQAQDDAALQVQGMTPNDHAGRVRMVGKLPNGDPAEATAAFFARGTRVFQATVVGPQLNAQALETYLGGLKFPQ